MYTRTLVFSALASALGGAYAATSYAGDFVNPDLVLSTFNPLFAVKHKGIMLIDCFPEKNYPDTTKYAQKTVVNWAQYYASPGPWGACLTCLIASGHCITSLLAPTNKSADPPSGDRHDYMSWAP